MERLKIEELLNNLWHEYEVYILRIQEELNSKEESELRKKTDTTMEEAERQLSYTFIELGGNENGKGHRVDAVIEQAISLSKKADSYLNGGTENPHAGLLDYYLTAIDKLMVNIRAKFSHFQFAILSPPPHYIKHVKTSMADKVRCILETLKKADLKVFFVGSLEDYFTNPIPSNHSSHSPQDGFKSLDYFVGLVESLYEICLELPKPHLEEAIYYELINRNFNKLKFFRALVSSYRKSAKEIEDPREELEYLLTMKKEIGKIPVIAGMAYIHSGEGLKQVLQKAITEEIKFVKVLLKNREQEILLSTGPAFKTNTNILRLLLLFNVGVYLSVLTKIGKASVCDFIHQNFVKASGDSYSLESLKKKNSQVDRKTAEGLITILNKVITYIKRTYL